MKALSEIGTEQHWLERKRACLTNVYTDMTALIADSKAPKNVSLAAFRPKKIKKLVVAEDEREWKPEWLAQLKQLDMFTNGNSSGPRAPIEKIPYKFKYTFEDEHGRSSTMSIEDWEIGALYRNCIKRAGGDENTAIEKVRKKYETEFLTKKDITLFLGTTLKHHRSRHSNPFTIVGVFYPPRESQQALF